MNKKNENRYIVLKDDFIECLPGGKNPFSLYQYTNKTEFVVEDCNINKIICRCMKKSLADKIAKALNKKDK